MPAALTVIVPTVGRSELLLECLDRLRSEGGRRLEMIVVTSGGFRPKGLEGIADRLEILESDPGFAGACNHGLGLANREFAAFVNDDLLVEPGWMAAVLEEIRRDTRLAAVQGLNLQHHFPELIDGYGIGWNRFWRPVQLGHGLRASSTAAPVAEVFGTSATAAVYRRKALMEATLAVGEVFDSRLESYYEDVELAIRLRQRGWGARCVPFARTLHAGAASSRNRTARHHRLLFSNRLLVSARLFGRSFWRVLPLLLFRDAVEILGGIGRLRPLDVSGSMAGWFRAVRLFRHFGHLRASALPLEELARFRVSRASAGLQRRA